MTYCHRTDHRPGRRRRQKRWIWSFRVDRPEGRLRNQCENRRKARGVRKKIEDREEMAQPENQILLPFGKTFNALAVFAPSVRTNSNGKATVDVKLPDNLTRYRVMAVSVDSGKRFGKGESSITARQPLMVRPSAPRFMNFGDKIELPVVVQNQTDKPMTVDLAVRATNANSDKRRRPAG